MSLSKGCSVKDALDYGRVMLKFAEIESYQLDALVILCFVTKMSKEQVFANKECGLLDSEIYTYSDLIDKRAEKMPVQYIVGGCEFMGIDFYVNKSVLIPRPDTEIVTEKVIEIAKEIERPVILDLCTGSGCIAVSVAKFVPNAEIYATDVSEDAVNIADRNAHSAKVSGSVKLFQSNLFEFFEQKDVFLEFFDIIVANPPYIPHSEKRNIMEDVKNYEPEGALFADNDGLWYYEKITEEAGKYLKKQGYLFFEIGHDQAEAVTKLMANYGFKNISLLNDLAGKDRVLFGNK